MNGPIFWRLSLLAALLFAPGSALGADFYLDPVNGSMRGDGSPAKPWDTLQNVIESGLIESRNWESLPYKTGVSLETTNPGAPVRGGDTLHLLSGDHGEIVVLGAYNTRPISVVAEPGHQPLVSRILVRAASNWKFQGLTVSPSFAKAPAKIPLAAIVHINSHGWQGPAHDIEISNCRIFSAEDSSAWTESDWKAAQNGIFSEGERSSIVNNEISNVRFAIALQKPATHSKVQENRIVGFSGDGIRGLSNYSIFESNFVANSHAVDGNHDDGFQSWSMGADGKIGRGEVIGVTLRGNTFINHLEPSHPLAGPMQGIGCFGGFYTDWIVENNVVITDHWHGITFSGARNLTVINNTIFDPAKGKPGPSWIMVGPHPDGRASHDITIRNNIVHAVHTEGTSVIEDHNLTTFNESKVFVDASGGDLRLKTGSPAIDAGASTLAPTTDIVGATRGGRGASVDIGAYESNPDGESAPPATRDSRNPNNSRGARVPDAR